MNRVMTGHRRNHDTHDTYRIENEINQMRRQLKEENTKAVNERQYDYAIGTRFTDMINECEKLGDYVVNVIEARMGLR
jgi:phosphate:Na+ symporter